MVDKQLAAAAPSRQRQVTATEIVHATTGYGSSYCQVAARGADSDVASPPGITLQRLQYIEEATVDGFCYQQIAAAAVNGADVVKFSGKQVNACSRANGQGLALQRLAAQPVCRIVQLFDGAAGRVQINVIPGHTVVGLQSVAQCDVIDGV